MITEIGITAGEIWHHLDGHQESTLNAIVSGTDKPRDITLMSVGWLAREGHIIVEQEGDDYKIRLRK